LSLNGQCRRRCGHSAPKELFRHGTLTAGIEGVAQRLPLSVRPPRLKKTTPGAIMRAYSRFQEQAFRFGKGHGCMAASLHESVGTDCFDRWIDTTIQGEFSASAMAGSPEEDTF
jgi:hypothetical protein